ncbi:MAG TPA: ABC-F family ATP-binding cassette domain-containing protein [Bacteroidia bacterium]|nr:ABC-F family ATP-binding cassette domain-containing protein [Bacteroidia bacterium]
MNILSVENISRSYGDRVLFRDISFGLSDGEKVALVARNGAGKTTLLNILAGKDQPDSGRVSVRKDITIGFLKQDPQFAPGHTVIEAALGGDNEISSVVREYELVSEKAAADPSVHRRLDELIAKMDSLEAWDHETKVKALLSRLGFTQLSQTAESLSGGQKKRLALAQQLIASPQLLILDEPTNHLDLDMIEWLENYLISKDITLLLVTHDRYFLDRVCDRIIEIDNGKLFSYEGDYSYFVEKKSEREEAESGALDKARNLYRRELAWVRKMPKARGTKAKARKDAFRTVAEKAKGRKPEEELKLEVKMTRLGGKILELIRISKNFGAKIILKSFDYTFRKGEKVGIIGKNGSGKSTFLNILLGLEKYDAGKIQTGETVVFGYYSQDGMITREDKRVIEVVKEIADVFPLADGSNLSASQMLQRFLFPVNTHYNYVSALSGGERRRLYLLTVLMKNPNFLVLDEPTNDLDILTLSVLEDFLSDFPGCVIVVSHDRYFMDRLVDHLFVFEGDGVVNDFPGNYSQWRERQDEAKPEKKNADVAPAEEKKTAANNSSQGKRKPSFKEKFEFDNLEKEIPSLEKEKSEITQKLSTVSDHVELQKLSTRFSDIEAELDQKTLRWMELAEIMEA